MRGRVFSNSLSGRADEYPDGDPLSAEVIATLVRSGHAIDAEIDRAMIAPHGWPQAILNCLAVIEGAEITLTPGQIGEHTLTSSATMTSTLDTLEHLGWARRVANPDDRRSVLVEVTADGQAPPIDSCPASGHLEQAALSELTSAQRATLLKLLGKVPKGWQHSPQPSRSRSKAAETAPSAAADHTGAAVRPGRWTLEAGAEAD